MGRCGELHTCVRRSSIESLGLNIQELAASLATREKG
jgi:hypothetical protein